MKKHCCAILIALCMSVTPMFGQMILTEEDNGLNPRATATNPPLDVMVPLQDVDFDHWNFSPLRDSLLLLLGLGGGYLLAKKKEARRKK